MSCPNPENERVKRRYFDYLREAHGRSPKTIEIARLSLAKFDRFTACKAYQRFSVADAKSFKRSLLEGDGKRRSELSSRSAAHSTATQVQRFFRWLAGQPGYKKAIAYADVEYFSLSRRDRAIAFHRAEKPSPSVDQVFMAIRSMPAATNIQIRDRALIAFALLTGARVGALISMKLKHVRADRLGIIQDAREVATKFGKTFPTFFFPVGKEAETIFLAYVDWLRAELKFGPNDPLFPATRQVVRSAHMFENEGLGRSHWETAEPVRRIFRRAFAGAGLPYYSPHTIRRTLALRAQECCRTPAELKAWSQNLGHDEVLTTLTNYGAIPETRQVELIRATGDHPSEPDRELTNAVAELIRKQVAKQNAGDWL